MPAIIGIALWALIPGFIAKKKGRNFWGYFFLSFLITPLITMIITACLKNTSVELDHSNDNVIETTVVPETTETSLSLPDNTLPQASLSSSQSLNENHVEESAEEMPIMRKIQFCRRCGFKLIDGSIFCSKCGNRIENEDEVRLL